VDQSTTLLHYLCSTVSTKSPELLTFPEDLTTLKQASRMNFGVIASNYNALETGIRKVEAELPHAPSDSGIAEFVAEARGAVDAIERDISKMNGGVQEVAQYFGETGGKEAEEPFRIMDQFVDAFVKARSDVEKAKQLKEDKAKRAAARQSQKKAAAAKGAKPGPKSPK